MPEAFAIGGFLIPTRPLGVIASLLVAVWASGWIAARVGLERSMVRGIAGSIAWVGLAGAKLGFVLMNWGVLRAIQVGELNRAILQNRIEQLLSTDSG
jgi:hypothetical protein